jgi:hypothetical protein
MTKAATAIEESPTTANEPVAYDARLSQRIPLTLTKNGQDFQLFHTLGPLTDERYFKATLEIERFAQKGKLTSGIYTPKHRLWMDLVESREGYKERSDWKEKTHHTDALQAVNALLHAQVIDQSEVDAEKPALFDEDELTVIPFRALQSGVLITLSHSFREETAAEMDAFLAMQNNAPDPSVLASGIPTSDAEKLARLGRGMLREHAGYAPGSEIPAWHLATTTESFFLRQMARLGKS